MDTTTTKAVTALYVAAARQVAGIAYLVTGHERVAARLVADAFGNAGLHPAAVGAWPSSPESWLRAEVLRLAERPSVRLRLLSLPAPRDPRDIPVVFGLAALPAHQRAALVLHHVAGLDAEDVALETQATVGATAARIGNAEAALAAADPALAVDLGFRLRGAARRARVPLPTPRQLGVLPGRRAVRGLALAGAGAVSLAFSPSIADRIGPQPRTDATMAGAEFPAADALKTALGQEERVRQDALVRAYEARQVPATGGTERTVVPADEWTPEKQPADFLPQRRKAPRVAKVDAAGKARGYVEKAFLHDGRLFMKVERQRKDGNVTTRVYRVRNRAEVDPGRGLAAALPSTRTATAATGASTMPLAQYLWLVQEKHDAAEAPVVLHYDKRGRITKIAEDSGSR